MKALARALNEKDVKMTRVEQITDQLVSSNGSENLDFLVSQFKQDGEENSQSIVKLFHNMSVMVIEVFNTSMVMVLSLF